MVSDNEHIKRIHTEVQSLVASCSSANTATVSLFPDVAELVRRHEERKRAKPTPPTPDHAKNASVPSEESTAARQRRSSWEAMSLQATDFDTMLEAPVPTDKPSAQTIRRRLGLLDRSMRERTSERSSMSETRTREEQQSLESDMFDLAKQLKERTQSINQSLQEDTKILDAVGQSAESNTELLEREHAVLKRQLASSIGFWTSLWLVLVVVVVFFLVYVYMKIFSRRVR
ncbi:TPA: hypothetical protein N0F65_002066 [Lagenidium giganteum]|uniref:Vesicle transport protein USE1 n=1 Tax=Lagenidium giganteum TaxID=4803 RepID=A0AAV2ZHF1_9STRA|nr:TPA: hypothetical protein N0F65_002066 [Lagenidium giganteum]